MNTSAPSPDIVEYFSYDPRTGHIIRIKQSRGLGVVGARAERQQDASGRLVVNYQDKKVLAHRLAWLLHYGEWPKQLVDHVNGNPADNRIANLRMADAYENCANCKGHGKHLKGVTARAGGRFQAQIMVRREYINLGLHATQEAAHEAYKSAATLHFGEFARFE